MVTLPPVSILCFGEAIVDLVCEREASSPTDVDCFVPRFGGALANVAVAARRAGAETTLAGGVGDDPWGGWLRERLEAERVDLRWFSLVPGARTPIALVTFDAEREAGFQVYGEGIRATVESVGPRLAEAVAASEALVFGSNTLVGEPERELTLRARELALEGGVPVLFDPNLRAHRWGDLDRARGLCLSICEGAFCVRANEEEGRWLTGESDPAAAAEALAARGARIAVVTRGADGAVARGECEAEQPGVKVDVVSPLGAGDAFMGTLAAGLSSRGWAPRDCGEAMAEAVEAAALTCTVWRAVL
jgi:sugar/nucleoside kinase (ribokinase family)